MVLPVHPPPSFAILILWFLVRDVSGEDQEEGMRVLGWRERRCLLSARWRILLPGKSAEFGAVVVQEREDFVVREMAAGRGWKVVPCSVEARKIRREQRKGG